MKMDVTARAWRRRCLKKESNDVGADCLPRPGQAARRGRCMCDVPRIHLCAGNCRVNHRNEAARERQDLALVDRWMLDQIRRSQARYGAETASLEIHAVRKERTHGRMANHRLGERSN